jgi:hypothetical protein
MHENLNCPICGLEPERCLKVNVLGKYDQYMYSCKECGFLFFPSPHWLEEAYSAPIASTDTGLMLRNLKISEHLAVFLYFVLRDRGFGGYVDVAGGYGVLVRLMRDWGFQFFWQDKYCVNAMAPGFEFSGQGPVSAVTAMEVLEHLEDPLGFCRDALGSSGADTLIFSTCLYGGVVPDQNTWSYYSFETGQHIGFFQRRTLECIASQLSCFYYGFGDMHVISRRPLNRFWMKIAFSRLRSLFTEYVRLRMKSLVTEDHLSMVERLRSARR